MVPAENRLFSELPCVQTPPLRGGAFPHIIGGMAEIDTPEDLEKWLSRFGNNGREELCKPFTIDTMRFIAWLAGNPEAFVPAIHVAGSRGKGSVTAMITGILEAAGLKTARYTSPQITDYWDRICQGNAPFHEGVYVEAGRRLARVEERRLEEYPESGRPSRFEMFTLLFFLCAKIARADAMIVETGPGGIHDATNIVIPAVSVLTPVEKKSAGIPENTLRSVAGAAAGIIRNGKPVISARQEDEAAALFREIAAEKDSAYFYLPDRVRAGGFSFSKEGTRFSLEFTGGGAASGRAARPLFPEPLEISLRVPGEAQAWNAVQAIASAKTAFPQVDAEAARRGLASLSIPARFERLRTGPDLVIDGAHTPESAAECVKIFTALYGKGGVLLFGCAAGGDAAVLAALLVPHFSRAFITKTGEGKAGNVDEAFAAFRAAAAGCAGAGKPEITLVPGAEAALREALRTAKAEGLPVLAAGSFFLVSEVRRLVRGMVV